MRLVRTFAVGMGLSAYLMYAKYTTWAQWFISDSTLYRFWIKLHYASESTATVVSLGAVATAGYIMACLALGLFIAGIIYPVLESFFVEVAERTVMLSKLPRPMRRRLLKQV